MSKAAALICKNFLLQNQALTFLCWNLKRQDTSNNRNLSKCDLFLMWV